MGTTKKELFSNRYNQLASMSKAMGHPARIAILDHLKMADQCINSDLVEEIGLAQSTISQHLKELKAAGLIKGTVEGSTTCYCIDQKVWAQFESEMAGFLSDRRSFDDSCC